MTNTEARVLSYWLHLRQVLESTTSLLKFLGCASVGDSLLRPGRIAQRSTTSEIATPKYDLVWKEIARGNDERAEERAV